MDIIKAEKYMAEHISKSPNMLVPYYLMCAYAYYKEDWPIVTDSFYDKLAVTLEKKYDTIEHMHKYLINIEDLKAGTYLGEYPEMVIGAVHNIRKKFTVRRR